ncbi:hypothetical protein C8J56DRAFT_766914, partial [Mycena floridula]
FGHLWRKCRRIGQNTFKPDSIIEHHVIQISKTRDFLCGLLSSPEKWIEYNRTLSAAITMSSLYGYDISPTNHYFVNIAEDASRNLAESVFPGV